MYPAKEKNMVRIRNKAAVTEINITEEQLAQIEKIKSNCYISSNRRGAIKKLIGVSLCCMCDSIPSVQLNYRIRGGGGTLVEFYCDKCVKF